MSFEDADSHASACALDAVLDDVVMGLTQQLKESQHDRR